MKWVRHFWQTDNVSCFLLCRIESSRDVMISHPSQMWSHPHFGILGIHVCVCLCIYTFNSYIKLMFACLTKTKIDIPKHLAFIVDDWGNCIGETNRRQLFRDTVQWCLRKGIGELSFMIWPSAQWPLSRTNHIQEHLHPLFDEWLAQTQSDVAFNFVSSSQNNIHSTLREKMYTLKTLTHENTRLIVYIYVSYSYSEDMQQCIHKTGYSNESVVPSSCPDVLIRTDGVPTLSNFCLWHLRFTELVFINPSFTSCTVDTWDQCLIELSNRRRLHQ